MNLIKAHGGKGSGPFSFERSATSPPQADHVLVDLFSSVADTGLRDKALRQTTTDPMRPKTTEIFLRTDLYLFSQIAKGFSVDTDNPGEDDSLSSK